MTPSPPGGYERNLTYEHRGLLGRAVHDFDVASKSSLRDQARLALHYALTDLRSAEAELAALRAENVKLKAAALAPPEYERTQLQRYSPEVRPGALSFVGMDRDPTGDYVDHDGHVAAITALEHALAASQRHAREVEDAAYALGPVDECQTCSEKYVVLAGPHDQCPHCALAEARRREDAYRDVLWKLRGWSDTYGAALKPGSDRADTYGEGVRDCKAQVAAMIARAALEPTC